MLYIEALMMFDVPACLFFLYILLQSTFIDILYTLSTLIANCSYRVFSGGLKCLDNA